MTGKFFPGQKVKMTTGRDIQFKYGGKSAIKLI